jgi:hypothetical protein
VELTLKVYLDFAPPAVYDSVDSKRGPGWSMVWSWWTKDDLPLQDHRSLNKA